MKKAKKTLFGIIAVIFIVWSVFVSASAEIITTSESNVDSGGTTIKICENFDDFSTNKTTPHSNDSDYCQPEGWYLAHRFSSQTNGFLRPATDAEKGAVMQVGMLGNDGGSSHAYLPLGTDITSGVVTISCDI
ncbi:MAG: hypothetical protein J6D26_06055, partial [Clostridia bacterium]|nr:hypothetical protein [Clostridia bacterium]